MIIATGHIACRRFDAAKEALRGMEQPEGYGLQLPTLTSEMSSVMVPELYPSLAAVMASKHAAWLVIGAQPSLSHVAPSGDISAAPSTKRAHQLQARWRDAAWGG